MTKALLVYVTAANRKEADKIAQALVDEKLAACVSIIPEIVSRYWWRGRIEAAKEIPLIIKTTPRVYPALEKRVRSLHSYKVPEILAMPIAAGNPPYLKWLQTSLVSGFEDSKLATIFESSKPDTYASLILASASPRRRLLLKKIGIPFRVIPSRIPEKSSHKNPVKFVQDLALQKAQAVAGALSAGIVLGADTVVVLKGRILGKPLDAKDAFRMLSRLSGSTHQVYTGIAVVDARSRKWLTRCAKSVVRMKKIAPDDLLKLSRKHLDKAGSYAIQEKHDPIARVIKGSYDNVVGLPVDKVARLLNQFVGAALRARPR